MNIGGVTTNYSAAYDTEKAQNAGTDKNFAEEIANAAQMKGTEETSAARGSDEESEDTAVFRVLYTDSGIKYTVYKTKDFSSENPIYKVKIWNEEDNMTERLINASKINPRNCDTFEMEVYAAHLKETGKDDFVSSVLSAAIAKAASQANQKSTVSWDYSTRINWVDAVKYAMHSSYNYGDLKGYMEWKKFLSFLE